MWTILDANSTPIVWLDRERPGVVVRLVCNGRRRDRSTFGFNKTMQKTGSMLLSYSVFAVNTCLIADLLASTARTQQYHLCQVVIHASQLLSQFRKALHGSGHVHTYL